MNQHGLRYRNAPAECSMSAEFPIVEAERLEGRSRGIEAAILALRTRWGIDFGSFAVRFGQELAEQVLGVLKKIPPHLARFEGKSVSLTPAGMRVGNAIWVELLELER